MTMNWWDQIRQHLQPQVSVETFNNWLKSTSFAGVDGDTLFVSVPDRGTRDWLEEADFATLVRSAIRELDLPLHQVNYEVAAAARGAALGGDNWNELDNVASTLNPKFTFDNFVVGACNQFAHAAARSVVSNPARS